MHEAGDRISRYRLEEVVGKGASGRVFRAFDEELHRTVALKLMLPELKEEEAEWRAWKARMMSEARATAALNHRNVVTIHDVGEIDELPYLVMEFIPGQSLRSYIKDLDTPVSRRLRWLVDAARALRAAHAANLIHRDVKPENVLVRDDGVVKVVDFGFARKLPGPQQAATGKYGTLTGKGRIVGTPKYVAPERLRSEPVDARADQFSWGVMAYEVLSGQAPWSTDQLPDVLWAILREEPPSLLSLKADILPQVADAVHRTMAKTPAARFPSMNSVVELLGPWVEEAPSATREWSAMGSGPVAVGVVDSGEHRAAHAPTPVVTPPPPATTAPGAPATTGPGAPATTAPRAPATTATNGATPPGPPPSTGGAQTHPPSAAGNTSAVSVPYRRGRGVIIAVLVVVLGTLAGIALHLLL